MSENTARCTGGVATELTPGFWIAGTLKHKLPQYYANDRYASRLALVESVPRRCPWGQTNIVCPNYGIPVANIDTVWSWWTSTRKSPLTVIYDKGGHGRSGMIAAVWLSLKLDISGEAAIEYIRTHHCPCAIETRDQWLWAVRTANRLRHYEGSS